MSISLAKAGAFPKIGYPDTPRRRTTDPGGTGLKYIEGKPQQPNIPTGLRIAQRV